MYEKGRANIIHHIWFIMMSMSIGYACFTGKGGAVLSAALEGCESALALTLKLSAGYLFFCGMMEIAQALRAQRGMMRMLRPLLIKIMPNIRLEETAEAVTLNLALNVLGLGNAATPAGLEAMRRMESERQLQPDMWHDMQMFLIINATSIQLLPTTVLAMRAAAGSANVNAVLIPTLLCTAFSTVTGIGLGMLCRRFGGKTVDW